MEMNHLKIRVMTALVHKVINLFIYVLCIFPNQKMLMTEGLNILYCVCWGVFVNKIPDSVPVSAVRN
jgi:hypothetical protein